MSAATGTDPFWPLSPGTSAPTAGGGTVCVDPAALEAESKVLQEVGSAIPGQAVRLYGPSDDAVFQLYGWRIAAALDACTEAWVDLLRKFGTGLDQSGEKLHATATNYRASDTSATKNFQNLLNGPGLGDGA
ncbi:hypothetical protein [Streptacidiphilus sp. MAP5-3]|uniref:hypothetical protein n=1 Tax=unclassified Streptacidiphilus TaxID=2643834 RepID=UPI0035183E2F